MGEIQEAPRDNAAFSEPWEQGRRLPVCVPSSQQIFVYLAEFGPQLGTFILMYLVVRLELRGHTAPTLISEATDMYK